MESLPARDPVPGVETQARSVDPGTQKVPGTLKATLVSVGVEKRSQLRLGGHLSYPYLQTPHRKRGHMGKCRRLSETGGVNVPMTLTSH